MNQPTARWTTLLATVALVALPALTFAQDPSAPTPQTPPSASAPQTTPQSSPSQSTGMDAAKAHLTTARNTLSELTQLPAAGQLQGEMRSQVAQLINNFNELITTQSDWKVSYAKVDTALDTLLATPEDSAAAPSNEPNRPTGTAGAVGTSGTKPASLDPTIRAKLVKLRAELDEFEKAAGGTETAATPSPSAAPATPTATPTAPPASTSSTATNTTTTSSTSPTTSPTTTTTTSSTATQPPGGDTVTISAKEAIEHINAIESMLNSGDAKLSAEQLGELKAHLVELRRLIEKQ